MRLRQIINNRIKSEVLVPDNCRLVPTAKIDNAECDYGDSLHEVILKPERIPVVWRLRSLWLQLFGLSATSLDTATASHLAELKGAKNQRLVSIHYQVKDGTLVPPRVRLPQ